MTGDSRPPASGAPDGEATGDRARRLAGEWTIVAGAARPASVQARLDGLGRVLRAAYRQFNQASEKKLGLSYAAEWLLDNYYLVQQAIRQIEEDMPPGYYRQLPTLGAGHGSLAGQPRAYALAREMVTLSGSQLDVAWIARFVAAFQEVGPLTMGEIWAVPVMLRLATVERLAQAISRLTGGPIREPALAAVPPFPPGASDDAIVANSITSLRVLATHDWKEFFEQVSLVEQQLGRDPARVYPAMDFETRDRYRKVVEDLALHTGRQEVEVARAAVDMAAGPAQPAGHVGYYLIDAGRELLEHRLGYLPAWPRRAARWLQARPLPVYLGAIALLTLILEGLAVGVAFRARPSVALAAVAALLALVPASQVAVEAVNWIVTVLVKPRVLPKLDFEENGIPGECRTVVVIPAQLAGEGEIDALVEQLEQHYLSNTDPELRFAFLADPVDAAQANLPEDDALLERARAGIEALNERYAAAGRPFYLFYRPRRWNPAEGVWMAWERKRGNLQEFNALLLGAPDVSISARVGDVEALGQVRYVITLDADTALPWHSAHRLIGTLAHPLNQAVFDARTGHITAGYTVLQPRIDVRPTSANQSLFARIMTGSAGLDLYTFAVSDVYQDLFGEGVFVGKGIYDLAAFQRSLAGRVPDNALLSHDLFEGIHGRAGLVTDVVLYEDYPAHYLAHARRMERWIRGDWQLLPWLGLGVPHAGPGRVRSALSVLDWWKLVDNLRRSLFAPALVALLVAGWLWLPGSPLFWTLAAVLAPAVPVLTGLFAGLAAGARQRSLGGLGPGLWVAFMRWALALVFAPYEALLAVDAIAVTVVRLAVTHRSMLQWTTAARAARLFGRQTGPAVTWQQMAESLILAVGLGAIVVLARPAAFPAAALLLAAWLISPQVAYWISRPLARAEPALSAAQRHQMRLLARYVWLFFERFTGPDDQWLPPDHFQENPRGTVAHRTSPTNIGLMLLSALAAHDMGYLDLLGLAFRLRDTFQTLDRMERHRGHFLNWYSTRSLEPLPPSYVSSVDSGNLAACLIALRQGCLDLLDRSVVRWARWEGLLDTLSVLADNLDGVDSPAARAVAVYLAGLRQDIAAARAAPRSWPALAARLAGDGLDRMNDLIATLVESGAEGLDVEILRRLRIWSERVSFQVTSLSREYTLLAPWVAVLAEPPALWASDALDPTLRAGWETLDGALPAGLRLGQVAEATRAAERLVAELEGGLAQATADAGEIEAARAWCRQLRLALEAARISAGSLVVAYEDLAAQADGYVAAMDFRFLYDTGREVMHIGYNVTTGQLDQNYYDLLASESRIASIVAIAKGDVPVSHWLHLARPLTQVEGRRVLLSWSGTMFEYLMPWLLMRHYDGTLLAESCRGAVRAQIAWGRRKNVPWGVSESGYYNFDGAMNYQYRAFGVPGLGFKRGLAEDLVVTPYASLLALPLAPQAVLANIARLVEHKMLGRFGFYEAIDFTTSRLSLGQKQAQVQSYMAHHQAMILLSLVNYLHGDVMVERFHREPRIKSVELLLQERIPAQAPVQYPSAEEATALLPPQPPVRLEPWRPAVDAVVPQVHFLSNGRYGVLITAAGAGYSRWQGTDLTRWRADTTLDDWGTWLYVQDRDSGALWSAGLQPAGSRPEAYEVLFHAHKAEFRRRDRDVTVAVEVVVSPDDDVEIRRVTLTNHAEQPRRLFLSSYAELTLAPQATDRRHPAFNKLFVESEYVPELNALLFRRRPRSADEPPIYVGHWLALDSATPATRAYDAGRLSFLGRGRSARTPLALASNDGRLPGEIGATLDPVMALGQEVTLEPYATRQLVYLTGAAGSRRDLLDTIGRYRGLPPVDRAIAGAHDLAAHELRELGLTMAAVERIEQLHGVMLYPHAALRAPRDVLAANTKGQPGLWPYAISGDYPILLVRVDAEEHVPLVRELLQAHAYWRDRQVQVDLVVLNEREVGYTQDLQDQLYRALVQTGSERWLGARGGIFLVAARQMPEADRVLLLTAARAVFDGDRGPLAEQLAPLHDRPVHLPAFMPSLLAEDVEPTPPVSRPGDLLFDNGLGGFSADGREYAIYLEPGRCTPAPWINVIANPRLGFTVSEAGSGYTWAENSGENRLTAWSNDPVADQPGEALYLRDEETGAVWSPTPLPAGEPAPTLVRHGAGYTLFEHNSRGLRQETRLFAAPEDPVKIVRLRLENTWSRVRRITATYYAAWVLGTTRDETQPYILPEFYAEGNAMLARNPYSTEFGERVAFVAASEPVHGLTADRAEFLGRQGSLARPAALQRIGPAGTIGPGLDPCAAVQIHLNLAPGEARDVYFLVGQGAGRDDAVRLIDRYRDAAAVDAAWQAMTALWDGVLGTVGVRTPDPTLDVMLNRWLLYQALSCRLWGRSALYQSSGAFGFRDQLQDSMALVLARPDLAREHILDAARHQFEAGDVLHWWHPPSGRGVRTRCSDDLLWLPFVTAQYVASTGDDSILSEQVPFLRGAPLDPSEEERYAQYEPGADGYSLYEHCRRALERGNTSGPHGLPLIGSGDWNDGLNRVGIEGRGESVWVGWFVCATLTSFAGLAALMGEEEQADAYRGQARELARVLESGAWDGSWYLRAYYDDGTPLGSARNRECQIDSLVQSWAVLSGVAEPLRAAQAMDALLDRLVRPDDRVILLFTPPFDRTARDPGYIKGYLPGIRENGGQYTHAALWAVWAFAELGQGDRAAALFRLLNPITHGDTAEEVQRYRVEPYVIAADVYSVPPHNGRGGWTWYTGSAAWMYRVGIEAILGLRRQGAAFRVDPCIPRAWPGFEMAVDFAGTRYRVRVDNAAGVERGVPAVELDGEALAGPDIPVLDDGREHEVVVRLGREEGERPAGPEAAGRFVPVPAEARSEN